MYYRRISCHSVKKIFFLQFDLFGIESLKAFEEIDPHRILSICA